ncbi:MAG: DUF2235 domain-containing protein [Acidobacteriota bacterium]|nr:DUF2235 domain-containing protein [Acidobacteriota bacterium]
MGKKIIYCADGTWATPATHTNVYKVFKAVTISSAQMAFYDDGVGSDGLPLERLAGGAFGTGLWQKIKDGYAKIAHVYEKDDQVYIFGFSRGAYTARSLAGMIAACGLPTHDFGDDDLEVAFNAYRDKSSRGDLLRRLNASCDMYNAPIEMIGVWDTVGSLGIPSLFGQVDPVLYGFLDVGLNPGVRNAYHAIAIDEKRAEFPVTLWKPPFAPGQTVEQVYFCGCHSDVGGGNPDEADGSALSNITLAWMMSKAAALGIGFNPQMVQSFNCPTDPKYALDNINESWTPLWAFPVKRQIAGNAWIANSVAIRAAEFNSYRPTNLAFKDGVLGNYTMIDVVTQPGAVSKAGS